VSRAELALTAPDVAVPAKPLREIRGGSARVSWAGIAELWLFRQVLYALVAREIKVKYKQTVIGVGWAFVQPVIAALIFALFLGHLSHVASEGVPYLLFALAGMVVWNYFSSTLNLAAQSLVVNQPLLRKIYFPREILPLYAIIAGVVDLLPGLAVLLVVAFAYGVAPTLAWLLLPLPLLLVVVATAGAGIALSAINVFYRDVRYALPFVLQIALFASPVVYSLSALPDTWRTIYAIFNPVAASIDALRRIVIHGRAPDFAITFGALAWGMLVVLVAYSLFKKLEYSFSDRV
jgi:lipopolysaccharide transport system permease protein